jgi:putative RecB family exonuclease
MTAMAQESALEGMVTGQPADAAASSPDAPVDDAGNSEERGPRRPSLSPSRAADFKTCPLLYRFRTIDRLPERKSLAAVRGTLVHSVLERLYDLPARQRTADAARELVAPAWEELLRADPEVAALFAEAGADDDAPTGHSPEEPSLEAWLASAGKLVERYFTLEDPSRIEPDGREELVEVTLPDGLLLRGFVDRLDVAPNGAIRVVDYKTGSMPREAFEGKALFQMKFYALVLWRTRGVVASQLKLLYLGNGDALTYAPDEAELIRFERTLQAIWAAIERAVATGDFRPNRTRLCDWCDHQALCPSFGGTPPPFPAEAAAAAGWPTVRVVDRDCAGGPRPGGPRPARSTRPPGRSARPARPGTTPAPERRPGPGAPAGGSIAHARIPGTAGLRRRALPPRRGPGARGGPEHRGRRARHRAGPRRLRGRRRPRRHAAARADRQPRPPVRGRRPQGAGAGPRAGRGGARRRGGGRRASDAAGGRHHRPGPR